MSKHKQIKTKSRRIVDFMFWQELVDDYQTLIEITEDQNEEATDNE